MSKTISTTISYGITLTASYNPLTITNTGAITATVYPIAIYGDASENWTIDNAGTVTGYSGYYGIELEAGATITNTGVIRDANPGASALFIAGGSVEVLNTGTITGGLDGVALEYSGSLNNSGTISGAYGYGVYVGPSSAPNSTVINSGTIGGGIYAVRFRNGGGNDQVVIDPGAVFHGIVQGGYGTNTLELAAGSAGATGTLSNFGGEFVGFGTIIVDSGADWLFDAGSIASGVTVTVELAAGSAGATGTLSNFGGEFVGFGSIIVDSGADWLFDAGSIASGVTVTVDGTLTNGAIIDSGVSLTVDGTLTNSYVIDSGVSLTVDGSLTNGGLIESGVGLTVDGSLTNTSAIYSSVTVSGGSFTNQLGGWLISGEHYGIEGAGGFTSVVNRGTIRETAGTPGFFYYSGVFLAGTGTVTNSGLISGDNAGVWIRAAGSVGNAGTITGGKAGVYFGAGPADGSNQHSTYLGAGTVTNTGTISGGTYGIAFNSGAGTVVDAGTIIGTAAAIVFDGTHNDRVILDPGAVLRGGVKGGSGTNVLELAAGSTSTTGTLSHFASGFTNFGTILVDAGAKWVFDASNTIGAAVSVAAGAHLQNKGTISDAGISLAAGAQLANGGVITSSVQGVYAKGGAATVINTGTILDTNFEDSSAGVTLATGGEVSNTGSIISQNGYGVFIAGGTGVVVNDAGALLSGGYGGVVLTGGTVTNTGTILGGTGFGVFIAGSGTVVDAGTISGDGAVLFEAKSNNDRVILDPGAVLQGLVQGGVGTNVLELAAGGAGTLSAFGSEFVGFGTIQLDSGADWALDGATPATAQTVTLSGDDTIAIDTPGSFADTIAGFDGADTLDLTGLAFAAGATASLSGQTLTVKSGTTTDIFKLTGLASGTVFDATDDGLPDHGVLVEIGQVPCYCAGTRILTPHGEVAVEDLAIGDLVTTHAGAAKPIKWLGYRRIDCRRHPKPRDVWPVRIRAGAFGEGLPVRDLLLSPEHAVFVDSVLVPIRCLVNGVTIVQEQRDDVAYYHVELERHDVILAEGLPCESWLDCGHRGMFANCPVADLHPSFARSADHAWREDACAPLVEGGLQLDTIITRINSLAGIDDDGPSAHQAGELRGWIDSATHDEIRGWAWQPEHPHHFVRLEILAGEQVLGQTVANENRPDVRDAGHGDGRCGFTLRVPRPLCHFASNTIRVRRVSDHAALWNSGNVTVEATASFLPAAYAG